MPYCYPFLSDRAVPWKAIWDIGLFVPRLWPEVATREGALSALGTIRADRPFHLAAGLAWQQEGGPETAGPVVWVTGEVDLAAAREPAWSGGADASIAVLTADARPVASKPVSMTATARGFVAYLPAQLAPGEYVVRVKVQGKLGAGAEASEQVRVVVPSADATGPASMLGQALLFRRGPFSGPGFQPTADLRFRRAERLRLDVPLSGPVDAVSARVLDRKGEPLAVPATALQREDSGMRLASAEVTLAPLAAGDYLIEVSATRGDRQEKTLAAIRIVP